MKNYDAKHELVIREFEKMKFFEIDIKENFCKKIPKDISDTVAMI